MKNRDLIFGLGGIALAMIYLTHGLRESFAAVLLAIMVFIAYYGLRIFIKDAVSAIFVLVVLVIGLSFLDAGYQGKVTYAVLFFLSIACVLKRGSLKEILARDAVVFKSISIADAVTWFLMLMCIVSFGFMTQKGFFSLDFNHPSYELSIGRSYELSILKAPDLSYSGKFIRYHFLSTPLPVYFSHVLQMPLLSSLYFFLPYFFLLMTFLLMHFFFAEFPSVRLPMFLLFFTPLFASSFWDMEGLFQRTTSTNSFFLGFLIMVIAIYYLAKENFLLLIAAALFLILVKASIFLVLLGGVVLFLMRTANFKKLFGVLSILLPGFVLAYGLFLSGAHQHNSWIVFPSSIYYKLWSTIFIPIILLWSTIAIYRCCPRDRVLLALSSVSFSGLLGGAVLLTELTESNYIQFLGAAFFATSLVFWYWLQKDERKKPFVYVVYGLIAVCCATGFVRLYREPFKNLLIQNLPDAFSEKNLPQGIYTKMKTWEKRPTAYLSPDFIDAYTWLEKNVPHNTNVLFSKHYEVFSATKSWWPETGFLRSALSGQQMYCENYKYKSIGMEKDFPLRFANTINFYDQFVAASIQSKEIIDLFYQEGFAIALSKKRSEAPQTGFQKYLHPVKENRWPNRAAEIDTQLKEYLKSLPKTKEWATDFIRSAGIGYIILEMGDRPSAFLEKMTEPVYANPTVRVLKVK